MTTYVDEATWEWRNKLWCHLVADSLDELHSFAKSMGLKREWFQQKSNFPHYDLTETMRIKALRMGAVAANRGQIYDASHKLRDEFRQLKTINVIKDEQCQYPLGSISRKQLKLMF